MLRLLHTSDWHLGVSTGPVSRLDEQERFLDWLVKLADEQAVDAVLVTGDVFDTMHPPAEAERLYYRFLARIATTCVRSVVIVGGNHDSPSRLDAPKALLEEVGARVVGGVPAVGDGDDTNRLDSMLHPLMSRDADAVSAVCLAVPYVHEYRLGVRTTTLDATATRAAFQQAFGGLYKDLCDRAEARWPGVPLVATGHLTLGTGASADDYPQEIHQVGTIDGLPADILDARLRYVALGHIHRCYPIKDSPAWYCGSPIAYSTVESRTPRQVLLVEIDEEAGAAPTVTRQEVPCYRELLDLAGTESEVLDRLQALSWETDFPPLIHVSVDVTSSDSALSRRVLEAASRTGPAPTIVEIRQRSNAPLQPTDPNVFQSLAELSPLDVFMRVCDAKGVGDEERENLRRSFELLSGLDDENADDVLADIVSDVVGARREEGA